VHGTPGIAGLAVDPALGVVQIPGPVRRLAGNSGSDGGVDVKEGAPQTENGSAKVCQGGGGIFLLRAE